MIQKSGFKELKKVRNKSLHLFLIILIFSFFVNALMLTSPIFMLQIYDRVLTSRSEPTLIALSILVIFLYLMMGLLDYARTRVLARIGARFQSDLDYKVFQAIINSSNYQKPNSGSALKDLRSIQKLFSSPTSFSIFDLPWTPIFLLAIFIFHSWLGYLALIGGLIVISLTIFNQFFTKAASNSISKSSYKSQLFALSFSRSAETVKSLGMSNRAYNIWKKQSDDVLAKSISVNDKTGAFSITSKTFRMFLQSSMLALGAYLVLQNQLTPGAMIAGSIILGRALAPVEMAIAGWPVFQSALKGWKSLGNVLSENVQEFEKINIKNKDSGIFLDNVGLDVGIEKRPVLSSVSFDLKTGEALGVIGRSGSGKSTLARLLTGSLKPSIGKIKFGGYDLFHYDNEYIGSKIGYLPQQVTLFEVSIAKNIGRLREDLDNEMIVLASQRAGIHNEITNLPDGYNTEITGNNGFFSGGQIQRLGLARALYGDPDFFIFDEPNSNLDAESSIIFNDTIKDLKAKKKTIVIMAHRPAAIAECDYLLILDFGKVKAFGKRDHILKSYVKNYANFGIKS